MRSRTIAVALLAGLVVTEGARAQSLDVQRLMTPAQFSASGLAKLTPAELTYLNAWLGDFALRVRAVTLQAAAEPAAAGSPTMIESQIEGEFNGWDGETIFKLANGQIWQQASYAYTYHYAYRPRVLIYQTAGGHKMKVDGVSAEIFVKRLH